MIQGLSGLRAERPGHGADPENPLPGANVGFVFQAYNLIPTLSVMEM